MTGIEEMFAELDGSLRYEEAVYRYLLYSRAALREAWKERSKVYRARYKLVANKEAMREAWRDRKRAQRARKKAAK